MNMNQFYSYIPYEWFVENDINSYIKRLSTELYTKDSDANFVSQFFKHNISYGFVAVCK